MQELFFQHLWIPLLAAPFLLGTVIGRWWVLLMPGLMWALWFHGLTTGWWGYGMGDAWQAALGVDCMAGALAASLGILMRRRAGRVFS